MKVAVFAAVLVSLLLVAVSAGGRSDPQPCSRRGETNLNISCSRGRGSVKCPKGSRCDIHPTDAFATCCCRKPVFNCLADPCAVQSCPNQPNATCQSNFCGGCNARFFDKKGKEVTKKCCPKKLKFIDGKCFGKECISKRGMTKCEKDGGSCVSRNDGIVVCLQKRPSPSPAVVTATSLTSQSTDQPSPSPSPAVVTATSLTSQSTDQPSPSPTVSNDDDDDDDDDDCDEDEEDCDDEDDEDDDEDDCDEDEEDCDEDEEDCDDEDDDDCEDDDEDCEDEDGKKPNRSRRPPRPSPGVKPSRRPPRPSPGVKPSRCPPRPSPGGKPSRRPPRPSPRVKPSRRPPRPSPGGKPSHPPPGPPRPTGKPRGRG